MLAAFLSRQPMALGSHEQAGAFFRPAIQSLLGVSQLCDTSHVGPLIFSRLGS